MKRGLFLATAMTTLLAGCGFHLRRAPVLPPQIQNLYVASDTQDTALLQDLRRGLQSESTKVLDYPVDGGAVLSIIRTSQTSRPLVLSRRGQPLLYQVAYSVEYSLVAGGVVLIPPEVQIQTRNYNFSATNGIANEEQENQIYASLAKQMAQLIIYRLEAVAKSIPAATPPPLAATQSPAAATRPALPAVTRTAPAVATGVPPAVTRASPMVD